MPPIRTFVITAACAVLTAPLTSQSLTASVTASSDLLVGAFETGLLASALVPAGTNLPDGFGLSAQVAGGSAFGSFDVAISAGQTLVTIDQATFVPPATAPVASAFVGPGSHTFTVTFTPTRDYSGELFLRWNGIEQNVGNGFSSCVVDIDDDGLLDFFASNGSTTITSSLRSFTVATPLTMEVTMESQSTGPELGSHRSIIEIEFVPDSSTVAPGSFTPVNFGCQTSEGLFALFREELPLTGPLVGDDFVTRIDNIPAGSNLVVALLGIPSAGIVLTPIGMDFCFLWTVPVFSFPVDLPVAGSTNFWSLPIPNNTFFVGVSYRSQVIVGDPFHTNPAGAIITNAADAVIGGL